MPLVYPETKDLVRCVCGHTKSIHWIGMIDEGIEQPCKLCYCCKGFTELKKKVKKK